LHFVSGVGRESRKARVEARETAGSARKRQFRSMGARNLRWTGPLSRLVKLASLGAVALLIAFHGWLLAGRLAEDRWREPEAALRWLASLALLSALLGLRRAGAPLIHGRRGLVFWALVVLLHWSATPMAERGIPVNELLIAAPSVIGLLAGAVLLSGRGWERLRIAPLRAAGTQPLPPSQAAAALCLLTVHAARPPPV
jgi:hypothetical protein